MTPFNPSLLSLAQHHGLFYQCAWCGGYETASGAYVYLPKLARPRETTSHTICPGCAPALLAEARQLRAKAG